MLLDICATSAKRAFRKPCLRVLPLMALVTIGWVGLPMPTAYAQSAPMIESEAKRGMSGVWQTKAYQAGLTPAEHASIPFTREGRKRHAANIKAVANDKSADSARFLCLPQGPARAMTTAYPLRIFQTDDIFVLLYEENRAFQRVRVNGEFHDGEFWDPAFMGDSIGTWEGNSFVIRTRNFRDNMFLDDMLLPATDKSEIQQRLTLSPDGKTLDVEITVIDPRLYKKAWTAKRSFEAKADIEAETGDWVCGEPHRDIRHVAGLDTAPAMHPSRGETRETTAIRLQGQPVEVTQDQAQMQGIWSMLAAGLTPPPPPPAPVPGEAPPPRPTESMFPQSLTAVLQDWNRKPYEEKLAKMEKGDLFATPDNSCMPFLVPETAAYYGPYEILINDDLILMLFQADHQSRLVYMNIDLPENVPLNYTGTSVGRWDGNALVVTSRGWNDRTLIKQVAEHSDAMEVVERSELVDGGQSILVTTTFTDPGALTAPWQTTRKPARDTEEYQEYVNKEVSEYFECPTMDSGANFPRTPKR